MRQTDAHRGRTPRRLVTLAAGLALAATALGGCLEPDTELSQPVSGFTRAISAPRLEISLRDADLKIVGVAGRRSITVRGMLFSRGFGEHEADEGLRRVRLAVSEDGQVARLTAPGERNYDVSWKLTVEVPASLTRLVVREDTGDLDVDGVRGALDLRVVKGSLRSRNGSGAEQSLVTSVGNVEAALPRIAAGRFLFSAGRGDITLTLDRSSDATVEATVAGEGGLRCANCGSAEWLGKGRLRMKLGAGTARVVATTGEGTITIR